MRGSSELRDMIRKHGERETLLVLLEGKSEAERARLISEAAQVAGVLLLALALGVDDRVVAMAEPTVRTSVMTEEPHSLFVQELTGYQAGTLAYSARWIVRDAAKPVSPGE